MGPAKKVLTQSRLVVRCGKKWSEVEQSCCKWSVSGRSWDAADEANLPRRIRSKSHQNRCCCRFDLLNLQCFAAITQHVWTKRVGSRFRPNSSAWWTKSTDNSFT